MNRILMMMVACAFVFTACKKDKDKTADQKVDFTFNNTTDKTITIDLYLSKQDYVNNQNLHIRKSAGPGNTATFTGLKAGTEYYVDWYSEDHKYHNWANHATIPIPVTNRITPTKDSNEQDIRVKSASIAKVLFLKGNETKSEWLAVDKFCYDSSTTVESCWKTEPEHLKYHRFVLTKDFHLTEYYKDEQGNTKEFTTPMFIETTTPVGFVQVGFNRRSSYDNITYAPILLGGWTSVAPFSLDTIWYESTDGLYRIARQ